MLMISRSLRRISITFLPVSTPTLPITPRMLRVAAVRVQSDDEVRSTEEIEVEHMIFDDERAVNLGWHRELRENRRLLNSRSDRKPGWLVPAQGYLVRPIRTGFQTHARRAGNRQDAGLSRSCALAKDDPAPLRNHLHRLWVHHLLLGTANVVFWGAFVVSGILIAVYVTTSLHGFFAVLQGLAWAFPDVAQARLAGTPSDWGVRSLKTIVTITVRHRPAAPTHSSHYLSQSGPMQLPTFRTFGCYRTVTAAPDFRASQ